MNEGFKMVQVWSDHHWKIVCPECKVSNNFYLFFKEEEAEQVLYFECANCKSQKKSELRYKPKSEEERKIELINWLSELENE